MAGSDDDRAASFASPPCFLHEVDPVYSGLPAADAQQHTDVARWRKAERARLIEERQAIASPVRLAHSERIAAGLEKVVESFDGITVSAYWPFRGEPVLRAFAATVIARGGRYALPVVVARAMPLIFRAWAPGDALARGVWNIPVPEESAPVVTPDVVIAPVVGFDRDGYRLGYGGGFFDRTLAAMTIMPRVLGVGYAQAAIPTIYPQPHDIPMDVVVTEAGVVAPPSRSRGTGTEATA